MNRIERNRSPLRLPSPDDYSLPQLDAAERDMRAVLDVWPALTPSGFYVEPQPCPIPRSVEWFGPDNAVISRDNVTFAFWRSRMDMRTEEALAALIASRAWLNAYAIRLKTLDKKRLSQNLWFIAQRDLSRVSHGVFIAALDLEGFKVQQATDNLGQPTASAWTGARLKACWINERRR